MYSEKNTEYSVNDYRLYLEHSWGKKPEQKAREKAYNAEYYAKNKSKWDKYRDNAAKKLGLGYKDEITKAEAERDYNKEMADDYQKLLDDVYDPRVRDAKSDIIDDRRTEQQALNDLKRAKSTDDYLNAINRATSAQRSASEKVSDLKREKQAADTVRRSKKKREASAAAASNKAHRLRKEYNKTPLGKVENAVNSGKKYIQKIRNKHTKIIDGGTHRSDDPKYWSKNTTITDNNGKKKK